MTENFGEYLRALRAEKEAVFRDVEQLSGVSPHIWDLSSAGSGRRQALRS